MKSKKLLLFNACTGTVLGAYILYAARWRLYFDLATFRFIKESNSVYVTPAGLFLIILSIIGMAYYSEDERVNKLSHQLLFGAGLASVIPFLARLGGLLSLASAALYLISLKRFRAKPDQDA